MYTQVFEKHEKSASREKNMLLLSGSRAAGNLPPGAERPAFLSFAKEWVKEIFSDAITYGKPVLFVPYARLGRKTEEEYFEFIKENTAGLGLNLRCAPSTGVTKESLQNIGGIYVGGGHTYTLLDKLQKTGSLELIRKQVEKGMPYLGSSAGTIICCPTIKSTNDMPCPSADIVDLRSLGLIKAQLNCHYLDDSMHDPLHMGEKRDTRLREFCTYNPDIPVICLYEGMALRVIGNETFLLTCEEARNNKFPVFCNDSRTEIDCTVGTPTDISEFFETENHKQKLEANFS